MTTAQTVKPEMGTLISGTHCPEDLIPAFLTACDAYGATVPTPVRLAAELESFDDAEQASETVAELMDCLSAIAPFGCFFGSHPGDGADFGFWLTEEWTDALVERCIDESDWETVLSICEDEQIDYDDLCDAWQGEVSGYNEDQAGAEFAEQTAEECGMIDDSVKWPHTCIDWGDAWE